MTDGEKVTDEERVKRVAQAMEDGWLGDVLRTQRYMLLDAIRSGFAEGVASVLVALEEDPFTVEISRLKKLLSEYIAESDQRKVMLDECRDRLSRAWAERDEAKASLEDLRLT